MTENEVVQVLPSLAINHNFRQDIQSLESKLKIMDGAIIGDSDLCPLTHTFADGVYVREIFIPAGVLLVGKIHKHSHANFISKGRVSVRTQDGVEELIGPCTMVSEAGTKRIVYTHEDTVWTTIHVTNKTDLAEIEAEIIVEDFEQFDAIAQTEFMAQINGGVI